MPPDAVDPALAVEPGRQGHGRSLDARQRDLPARRSMRRRRPASRRTRSPSRSWCRRCTARSAFAVPLGQQRPRRRLEVLRVGRAGHAPEVAEREVRAEHAAARVDEVLHDLLFADRLRARPRALAVARDDHHVVLVDDGLIEQRRHRRERRARRVARAAAGLVVDVHAPGAVGVGELGIGDADPPQQALQAVGACRGSSRSWAGAPRSGSWAGGTSRPPRTRCPGRP